MFDNPYGIITLLIAVVSLLLVVFLALTLWRRTGQNTSKDALELFYRQIADSIDRQDNRLGSIGEQLGNTIDKLTSSLNERFTQSQSLAQQSGKAMAERLDSAGKTIADLKGQLGQLNQATQQITQVGSEVKKLQDILQSPKLRGSLGEWSLENLLADVLPRQAYQLQYTFKNGVTVDGMVHLAQGSVCIDAKFPLANFQLMLQGEDEAARGKARRSFLQDVCRRIDEIADKYILPDEGTLDFALMYVPAENVYYELTMAEPSARVSYQDVNAYGRKRKVIPVSPNTLYAYLMVIATGLKGLQIEKNAQMIYSQLNHLLHQLQLFNNDFAMLGKHLNNARAKYDDAYKKIDRLDSNLQQIATDNPEPAPPVAESPNN
jgi:DNA recombination protein RmuC